MISHKHKFIFIHIPKCGGTSIEYALLRNENVDRNKISAWELTDKQEKIQLYYKYGGVDVQHRTISQFNHQNEKSYFTFTFVRAFYVGKIFK